MIRSAILAFALMSTPALAAAPHFQAEAVVQPAKSKVALRDTLWNCAGATCSAHESSSRPAIVCAVLARQIGALRSFSVKGEALGAAELERCNGRAKVVRPDAVADRAVAVSLLLLQRSSAGPKLVRCCANMSFSSGFAPTIRTPTRR
jgi:hypothetical protein